MAAGSKLRTRANRGSSPQPVAIYSSPHRDMSYAQTPLPSTSTAEVAQDTPFPFVAHQPVGGSINAPGFQPQGIKKRKQSKSKPSPELRRSVSTPHIRGLAMGDAGASSPISDKKRNKLGYHRTSVACVHCRRRKIRCLLAPDDPQGRCTNCIRLKKECHFYPVEHQGGPEQRPPTAAVGDASSGAPSVSTPSSPRTSSTNFAERQQDQHQYSRMPNHPPLPPKQNVPFTVGMDGHASQYQSNGGEYSHLSTMATTGPLMAKTSMPHAALAYAPQNNWGPPSFLLQSNGSNETQQPHTTADPWQSMPQPTAPMYAESRPPGIPEQRNTPTVPQSPYAFSSSEPGWTAPTRSMSYGNIEGLPHQVPYGHFQPPQDYRPKPGAVGYPTPLNTNPGPSPMGSIHEHPPMSAPIVGSGQYGYPPGWNSYQVQTPGSDSVASSHPIHSPWLQEQAYSKHEEESGSGAHYAQHQQYYTRH